MTSTEPVPQVPEQNQAVLPPQYKHQGPADIGIRSEGSQAVVGWTSTNVRHEMMSYLYYQPATGLAPAFAAEEPASNWHHAVESLWKEGYARGELGDPIAFPVPADGTLHLTDKGQKYAEELLAKGFLRDVSGA